MKLLIINHEFPPIGGGASNASWYLARAMVKLGYDVSVATSSYKGLAKTEVREKVKIYRIPSIRKKIDSSNTLEMFTFMCSSIFFLPRVVRELNPNVLIAFFTIPAGLVAYYMHKKHKVPYLISLRGGDVPGLVSELGTIHKLLAPIRRTALLSAKKVIANSYALKYLSQKSDKKKVVVIPNGVDTNFYKPSRKTKKNERAIFLFVGRLHPQKNLKFVLEQLALLKKSNKLKFSLEVVGEGLQLESLVILASKLGMSKNVKWHKWLGKTELLKKYQSADCLLYTSLYEGMSNVILESMACGLPVIASDIPGNDELIIDGKTGFLFDLKKPQQFRKIVMKTVQDKKKNDQVAKFARNTVVKSYSWEMVAAKYINCLKY